MWQWRPEYENAKGEIVKAEMRKIGSLVLGSVRIWSIKIDKHERLQREKEEAEKMLQDVEKVTLDQLFQTKKKE